MPGQFPLRGSIAGVSWGRRLSGRAAGLIAVLIVLVIGVVFIIVSVALRSRPPGPASCRRTACGARR